MFIFVIIAYLVKIVTIVKYAYADHVINLTVHFSNPFLRVSEDFGYSLILPYNFLCLKNFEVSNFYILSLEAVPKLTEFWNKLIIYRIALSGQVFARDKHKEIFNRNEPSVRRHGQKQEFQIQNP
jgi:hypothetical protein